MSTIAPYPNYRDVDLPWLNQVPQHWATIPLGRVATIRNGSDYAEVEVAEGGYPVYGSGGAFRRASSFLYDGESVLFGRKGTIDRPVHVTGRFWTVDTMYYTELKPTIVGKYLFYYATVLPYSYYSTNTALPSMTQGNLAGHTMPLPPLDEQRAIADFLDRETGQIDRLIEKQEQLIDTLRERRAAVVAHAVTRGLDPLAPVKDTHVSWLGEVPAHWELRPLWSMFERIKDVDHPDEPMLSVFRDHGVVYKDSMANLNVTADNRSIYQLVHPGWLVSNRMKAWQGSVGISTLRGIVSGHYICFAPRHHEDDAYLNYLFRSPRYAAGYRLISRGVRIGQAEIDNDDYRVLPVLVPPLEEQQAIAAHLDDQTGRIDVLIGRAERFIGLARERRAALVSAAVTGRIDVRGAV